MHNDNRKVLTINEYALIKITPIRLSEIILEPTKGISLTSNEEQARMLLTAILKPICALRDKGQMALNKKTIIEYLDFKNILSLLSDETIANQCDELKAYMANLSITKNASSTPTKQTLETHHIYQHEATNRLNACSI